MTRKIAPKMQEGKGQAPNAPKRPEDSQALLKTVLMEYLTVPGKSSVPVNRDDLREMFTFVRSSSVVDRERFDKVTYEAANFGALYRNFDIQTERATKCLRGIQFILDQHEADSAFISYIPEAAALLSVVAENLGHWRERLAKYAEVKVGDGK